MITTKQRAELKKIAQNLKPVLNIGKENLTENTLKQIEDYLYKNEIMKIKILQNSTETTKDTISFICEKLSAEPVLCVGKIMIIYKKSSNKKIIHILKD